MADIKLSALDHLRLVALRGKADANERIAELAEVISAALEELDDSKADADHTHESNIELITNAQIDAILAD